MGMCASGDILQAKVYNMFGDIKKFKTYTYDILVLSKDCLKNHIYQPRIILCGLRAEGLNINAPKCGFGLKEIPYLS